MRLPYVPETIQPQNESDAAIVEDVKSRRITSGLLALDLALFHSLPVAGGWNSFFGSIRTGTSLPVDIRELVISRVAVLTGSEYEWIQHAPLAVKAGVSVTAMKGAGEGLTAKQEAALHYTDSITREIEVSDAIFEEVKKLFSDKEVVELTATIAAYNCCSRFLVALDIGERNGVKDVKDWDCP